MKTGNVPFTLFDLIDFEEEQGTCGLRKRIVTSSHCEGLAISHIKIKNAKRHYHEKITEFYYVLNGEGELLCNNETIALSKNKLVMIKPGVVHQAFSRKDLEVLLIMTPPYSEEKDIKFL